MSSRQVLWTKAYTWARAVKITELQRWEILQTSRGIKYLESERNPTSSRLSSVTLEAWRQAVTSTGPEKGRSQPGILSPAM